MTTALRQPITERDHVLGSLDAPVTLVEYGDFACPYCGRAYPLVKRLVEKCGGGVSYIFRHYPIDFGHGPAQLAAEASEAAAAQGRFWEIADLLFENQLALDARALEGYARRIALDVERFRHDLEARVHVARVAEDVTGAEASGVSWRPTFFVNGALLGVAAEFDALSRAMDEAWRQTSRRRRRSPETASRELKHILELGTAPSRNAVNPGP
jgi:protein-disulfide isomerase